MNREKSQKKRAKNIALAIGLLFGLTAVAMADTITPDYADMTFNNQIADGFHLEVGATDKDDPAVIGDIGTDEGWGAGWAFLVKDPNEEGGPTGSFNGITFSLTVGYDEGSKSGDWVLTAVDTNGEGNPSDIGDSFDFVGVIKAGNSFAAYYFDDIELLSTNGGEWKVAFLHVNDNGNNKNKDDEGVINALSHMSLYIRDSSDPEDETFPAPEPSGLILLGSGLLGLAAWKFRKH